MHPKDKAMLIGYCKKINYKYPEWYPVWKVIDIWGNELVKTNEEWYFNVDCLN